MNIAQILARFRYKYAEHYQPLWQDTRGGLLSTTRGEVYRE